MDFIPLHPKSTCVLASEREPPWAMTFDLRERETEWTQENKVSCLQNADKCCSEAGCRHLQINFSKLVKLVFIAFLLVSLHHHTCCETSPVSI